MISTTTLYSSFEWSEKRVTIIPVYYEIIRISHNDLLLNQKILTESLHGKFSPDKIKELKLTVTTSSLY